MANENLQFAEKLSKAIKKFMCHFDKTNSDLSYSFLQRQETESK